MAAPPPRYLRSAGGSRLAWASAGTGAPTLLCVPGWVSHLARDWNEPLVGRFQRALAARHRIIRYDRPGTGLSDREPADVSLERQVDDLERVAEASGEGPLAVFGAGIGGPVAIALAARRPELVSHLVLFGAAARPVRAGSDAVEPRLAEALAALSEAGWPLACRTLAELMLPDARPDEVRWYAEYQQALTSPEMAAATIRATARVDVRGLLPEVRAPALVLQRRDDRAGGLAGARELAATMPSARLVVLDGSASLPSFGGWQAVVSAVTGFLNPAGAHLTGRERELLGHLDRGLSNRQLALRLGISENTVARHLANLYAKLGVGSRAAAVATARSAGVLGADQA